MDKKILKNILKGYYSAKSEMPSLCVNGKRKPKYEIIIDLHERGIADFTAWKNIAKWLEEQQYTPQDKDHRGDTNHA